MFGVDFIMFGVDSGVGGGLTFFVRDLEGFLAVIVVLFVVLIVVLIVVITDFDDIVDFEDIPETVLQTALLQSLTRRQYLGTIVDFHSNDDCD